MIVSSLETSIFFSIYLSAYQWKIMQRKYDYNLLKTLR